jgi:hypothetical protein
MTVLFVARDELLAAIQQGRPHKTLAAIITQVHIEQSAVSSRLDLAVFDPHLGYQMKFDVKPAIIAGFSPTTGPEAGWIWPPPVQYQVGP